MRSRNLAMAFVVIAAVMATMFGTATTASASVSSEKLSVASQVTNAKKSTMDCNGVTYAHNGFSYGWGNAKNRVIYGFGSGGKVRAVKVYGDGVGSATWSIGVITSSGAVVESSGSGSTYCVEVPGTAQGAKLTSKYNNGVVTKDTVRF